MNEKHPGRTADRAAAMAAAADIIGEKHLAAAAAVLRAIAGFDFERAGKHEEKLAPGGRVPVLVQAFGHSVTIVLWAGNVAERRAVSPQAYTSRQGLEEKQKTWRPCPCLALRSTSW